MSGPDPNDPTTWGLSPEYLALLNRDLRALDSPSAWERQQGILGLAKNGRQDAVPKLVELLADDAPVIGDEAAGEIRQFALAALQRLHWIAKKPLHLPPVLVRPTMLLPELREAYREAVASLPASERDAVHARADDYLARRVMPSAHVAEDVRAYRVLQELGRIQYERQEVDPVTLLTPLQEQLYAHQVSRPPPPPRVRVALRERPETTLAWIHRDPGPKGWTATFSEHPARPDAESMLLEVVPSPGRVARRVKHDPEGRPVLDPKGNLVVEGDIPLDSGDPIDILRSFAAFLGRRRFVSELQLAAPEPARAAAPSGRVATLNDLSDAQLAEARAELEGGRARAVRYLRQLVDRCDTDDAATFIEEVLRGGADARSWRRRDRVCFPIIAARELVTRPVRDLLAPVESLEGDRWVRVRPRMSSWTASPAGGAPGVLVRGTPYWWRAPAGAGAAVVSAADVEPIADLELAVRRWIASQVASELRARPLPATPPAIAAALGVSGPLSRDGEIALTALILESSLPADDRAPGFRGPDDWFRAPADPNQLVVTADEARARGLPPVDLRVDISESGLIHGPLARRGGFYLRLHGPPGDPIEFAAWPAADDERGADGFERSLRRVLELRRPELARLTGGLAAVELAGGSRQAGCVYFQLPPPMPRLVTCVVAIEHAGGVAMVSFTQDTHPEVDVTPAQVLEHPRLRRLARSLRVS